jgi:hypothetical protein
LSGFLPARGSKKEKFILPNPALAALYLFLIQRSSNAGNHRQMNLWWKGFEMTENALATG